MKLADQEIETWEKKDAEALAFIQANQDKLKEQEMAKLKSLEDVQAQM